MAKKQFFLVVDTETTVSDTVADFGAVICDRHGKIVKSCAILVHGEFDKKELFYDPKDNGFWGRKAAEQRKASYIDMMNQGTRSLATVAAINRWLERAAGEYSPTLTAYNLPFDMDKCRRTGIDLGVFPDSFDLWGAAVGNICNKKAYKQFALENHLFNAPTDKGNMTLKTNAEAVAGFLSGGMVTEPHTALEDARDFEVPILVKVLKAKKWRENITPYNWRAFQVKDHFTAK